MQITVLYLITATVFLALDAVVLKLVMRPVFEQHLGGWLLDGFRAGPAIAFYLLYIAGLLWLVSIPALRAEAPFQALIGGAIIGAMAYGTYEFTNYATLRNWAPQMVALDVAWGTLLTGIAAWIGVGLTQTLT